MLKWFFTNIYNGSSLTQSSSQMLVSNALIEVSTSVSSYAESNITGVKSFVAQILALISIATESGHKRRLLIKHFCTISLETMRDGIH